MGNVFHRDLNVLLGPMTMDGVINQRRTRLEHGQVAPLSWPPLPRIPAPTSNRADRLTSAGVPICRYHAQLGNYKTTPLGKLHPTFCAVHD